MGLLVSRAGLLLNLPGSLENTLVLTLYWSEVANAKGYRIYRSPIGSETIDGVQLLAILPMLLRPLARLFVVMPLAGSVTIFDVTGM